MQSAQGSRLSRSPPDQICFILLHLPYEDEAVPCGRKISRADRRLVAGRQRPLSRALQGFLEGPWDTPTRREALRPLHPRLLRY